MTKTYPQPFSEEKKVDYNDNQSIPTSGDSLPPTVTPGGGGLKQWWQNRSLRFKTTSIAIALGVIPIVIVGGVASILISSSLRRQIETLEINKVDAVERETIQYIEHGVKDAQSLASVISSSAAWETKDLNRLSRDLNKFQELYRVYDNIAIVDTNGTIIVQSGGESVKENLANTIPFIEAKTKGKGSMLGPVRANDGRNYLIFAAPIIEPNTKQFMGVVRCRLPLREIQKIIARMEDTKTETVYLADGEKRVFLSTTQEFTPAVTKTGQPITEDITLLENIFPYRTPQDIPVDPIVFTAKNQLTGKEQLVAIQRIQDDQLNLNWIAAVGVSTEAALAPLRRILNFIYVGTALTAALVGLIAYKLAERLVSPLERTSNTIKKIASGDLEAKVEVEGNDEIAQLGNSINEMAAQLKQLFLEQQTLASQSNLLKNLTLEMTKAFNVNEVFEIAVREIRQALQADRVIVYSFDDEYKGTIIAESVEANFPKALGANIYDPCFAEKYVEKYLQGRVQATPDIYKAGLTDCHLQQLEPFQVKANLVAPIIAENKLLGLLIAHQCSGPRNWTVQEIDFFAQTAAQMGPALQRAMLVETQQTDYMLSQRLKDITFAIAGALNKEKVFEMAVSMGREALKADRMIVYTFDEDWKGTIIAESVDPKYPKALGAKIKDPCFAEKYVEKYKKGRIQATNNIYTAGLTSCHIQQLEPFEVKANLVAPIIVEGNLLGLLIAHQCSGPRNWTVSECNFLSQLATQIGPALERIQLLERQQKAELEQRKARERLQQRALELLMQVDPVAQGDLTIRATVTEDEIGTIADSYNATIESLRKIVMQVQGGAKAMTQVVTEQDQYIENLAQEIVRQADDINMALEKLQMLAFSAKTVLSNAEQAEQAVKQANKYVEEGEVAMNRTVDGILAIRETVAETAKKVKRLGESTQKISRVVNLISSFADQTNLLALNASIEAAHAGEEGRGFAVVAEEVRSLARQSAEATAEIEKVVAEIQAETNEVVKAMEEGTEQVVEGTRLVEETRASLNEITAAAAQISQLVTAIAAAAAEQSQTSEAITETMAEVAHISNETSNAVSQVARTFKKLQRVAESLEIAVSKFKVN